MAQLIYGKNPIAEIFRAARRKILHFYYLNSAKSDGALSDLLQLCSKQSIPVHPKDSAWFQKQFPHAISQGWAVEVSDYPYVQEGELLTSFKKLASATVLALDQIQDPQNLGAILRTAEACGVGGVLIPEKRSSLITPAVCKASAGAVEHLLIAVVKNLARSLAQFKQQDFWIVGTSLEAKESLFDLDWPQKTVLVLGSEGKGMRRLTAESCDFLIKLPMLGKIQSLNVSVSAAVCLFERLRKLSL